MITTFYDRETAERFRRLQDKGTRVGVYETTTHDMKAWCKEHCKAEFESSFENVLIDDQTYNRSIEIADGIIPNPDEDRDENWIEAKLTDAMAREIQRDIDREILNQLGCNPPYIYFWFQDLDDALLFKLTWGGQ